MKTLDQNIITWTIITTTSAKTYAFKKALPFGSAIRKSQIWIHHPNVDRAKEFVQKLETKGTQFTALFITDKQFSEMVINYKK